MTAQIFLWPALSARNNARLYEIGDRREQYDRERAQQAANRFRAPDKTGPLLVVNNDRESFNRAMLRLRQALNDEGGNA